MIWLVCIQSGSCKWNLLACSNRWSTRWLWSIQSNWTHWVASCNPSGCRVVAHDDSADLYVPANETFVSWGFTVQNQNVNVFWNGQPVFSQTVPMGCQVSVQLGYIVMTMMVAWFTITFVSTQQINKVFLHKYLDTSFWLFYFLISKGCLDQSWYDMIDQTSWVLWGKYE